MYFDLVRLYGKSYDLDKNAFGVPYNNTIKIIGTASQEYG
jgi:hypothetical protein